MDLEKLRKKIDELDQKIISLLNERTAIVLEVGKAKAKTGTSVYAPDRETQIYQKIEELAKNGVLPKTALKAIYREIMSASIALEKPISIAYFGPEATFTHLAAISKFGSSVNYLPLLNIYSVFTEVEQGRADYGVIPVENSIEGGVTHSLDMFIDSDLKICSEIFFEISHHLMSNSTLADIKRVYSHPQVFGQCRSWIKNNLPRVELIDTSSTTAAAKRAQTEDGCAAVASKLAATIYNLPVLARDIQDFAQNVTRFLVISRQMSQPTKKDKTSILLSIKDKVGALHEMLEPIRRAKVNMTKIESRPSKKKAWEYYFFIDFEGHAANPKIKKMLGQMESRVKFLKVLGSYPMIFKD